MNNNNNFTSELNMASFYLSRQHTFERQQKTPTREIYPERKNNHEKYNFTVNYELNINCMSN